jgi:hypothetical protein
MNVLLSSAIRQPTLLPLHRLLVREPYDSMVIFHAPKSNYRQIDRQKITQLKALTLFLQTRRMHLSESIAF